MPSGVTRLPTCIATKVTCVQAALDRERSDFRIVIGFLCVFAPVTFAITGALIWDALRGWENPSWAIFIMFALLAMFGIPFIFMSTVAWFCAATMREYKRRLSDLRALLAHRVSG